MARTRGAARGWAWWGAARLLIPGVWLTGCAAQSPSILAPVSPKGRAEADLFGFIFLITAGVFVLVETLLLYAVLRFRARDPHRVPPQIHGNNALEISWTTATALGLAVIFAMTWRTMVATSAPPADAMPVKVTGHQWWWEFEYPTLGITTANELVIPVGRPVRLTVTSADVIHSFWVPQLGGKMDAIPGRENTLWIQADVEGVYHGQCAELCGASHANMRLRVRVMSDADFQRWVEAQRAPAAQPVEPLAQQGYQVFMSKACVGCHTINGTPAQGKVGPNLTHVGSRTTIAAGLLENTPENLARWLDNPPAIKPGSLMPRLGLTPEEIQALVAYLSSLK
ncbi:Cytochrome c oxidase subunit 2 [Candidatus Thermoflexus japonica]|uniref:Cytochrome c oxidase subunit 2 n=1 Tax=Candidatus Thermoflexus japonica TaxID=2035417 RepID=A0A2H5Y3M9_9CHLR|nr:Cytochrome c oxidase subunit 2 [Candidatus Thermoflexus japonica]